MSFSVLLWEKETDHCMLALAHIMHHSCAFEKKF